MPCSDTFRADIMLVVPRSGAKKAETPVTLANAEGNLMCGEVYMLDAYDRGDIYMLRFLALRHRKVKRLHKRTRASPRQRTQARGCCSKGDSMRASEENYSLVW